MEHARYAELIAGKKQITSRQFGLAELMAAHIRINRKRALALALPAQVWRRLCIVGAKKPSQIKDLRSEALRRLTH